MEGGGEERSATPQHVKADAPVFSPGCVGRAMEGEGSRSGQISLFCDYEGGQRK